MFGNTAYAVAPFNHMKADIILRSSDNVHFRVFKLFLSLASPFFESLFNIPQPADVSRDQEMKDGLIVIPVTEDGKTLDTLLRFCYPCTLAEDPQLEDPQDLVNVLEAARKYSLDAIEGKILQAISNPQILAVEPLRCFAIARLGHAREETLLAAKYTLAQPLIPSFVEEIHLITAADLLALLTYHKQCGDAVYALKTDVSWITSYYGNRQGNKLGCPWLSNGTQSHSIICNSTSETTSDSLSSGHSSLFRITKWWTQFFEEIFDALRDRPCKATIESCSDKTVQLVRAGDCLACSMTISDGMREFSHVLAKKVEEVVSEVPLTLAF